MYCGTEFHDEPHFDNNFLATDANLIFLSKIDKELKSVIENIFFHLLCAFKKRCHRMEISTLYQLLFFFTIPYLYLNRAWLCDNCKVQQLSTKPKNVYILKQ